MKIGIFYTKENVKSITLLSKFKELLNAENISYSEHEESSTSSNSFVDLDLIVVFGGDGCVLSAVKLVLDKIPLVAVNAGSVGFLSDFETDELGLLIKAIKLNLLQFSSRRLLEIECYKNIYYAFNDAVILKDFQRDNYSSCIKLNLFLDGKKVDKYFADGLILSTATGSTAYALSAGAPIVVPDLEAVVLAPICAHSLQSRPIVFAPKSVADIQVDGDSRPCALYIDGSPILTLEQGDKVTVRLGQKTVKISDSRKNFFEKLAKKISGWKVN